MKFIQHNAAPDSGILHKDIPNRIKSKHTAMTVWRCKNTLGQKKCGMLNKLKSKYFSTKRQVAWLSLCPEYD